jgi:hypothetical protein
MELGITKLGGKAHNVFFNVEAPVGPMCPNRLEDVMLVQYLFRKIGQAHIPADQPELAKKFAAQMPSGKFDMSTAECILGFQKYFGGIADGRISVARGAAYGNGTYTIWKMNFWVRSSFNRVSPRIHDFPDCPPLLKSMIPVLL